MHFAWTIGGQPAATACSSGGQVLVESTSGPTVVNKMTTCDPGMLLVTDLMPGAYVFRATLSGGATPVVVDGIHGTVVVGQVATADAIDFPVAQATLTVSWTVNGGMQCPAGGQVTVAASMGGNPSGLQSGNCTDYQATITGLSAGTYVVDVIVALGNMLAMGEQQNVTLQAGANMVGPIDVTCTFCP
jgi:hypothetical protein